MLSFSERTLSNPRRKQAAFDSQTNGDCGEIPRRRKFWSRSPQCGEKIFPGNSPAPKPRHFFSLFETKMPFQLPVPWLFKSRPSFTFSRRVNHGHTTRSTKLHAIMARSGHRPLASLGPRTSPNTANPRSAANRGYGSYRCGFQPDESSSLLISRVIEKSNIWLIGGILFEETFMISARTPTSER